jgi:hypothetical protein
MAVLAALRHAWLPVPQRPRGCRPMNAPVEPFVFLAGKEVLGIGSEGWTLDQLPTDGLDRSARTRIAFSRAFRTPPLVHLGVTGFDISERDCARLTVAAENVTTEGCDIVLGTWFNTRLWRVEVSWLALGA